MGSFYLNAQHLCIDKGHRKWQESGLEEQDITYCPDLEQDFGKHMRSMANRRIELYQWLLYLKTGIQGHAQFGTAGLIIYVIGIGRELLDPFSNDDCKLLV